MSEAVQKIETRGLGPGPRPYRRNGQSFNCTVCAAEFYRRASFIKRGITKTCGKRECISVSMQKEKNPFWGKEHTPEVREALSAIGTAKPAGKKRGRVPGSYSHSPEIRAEMSERMRRRWAENRDAMLALFPAEPKPREGQRYRKNFTPLQRRTWKADKCAWCPATDTLVLDHIVSVLDGGLNIRQNAQTLCQPCNIWKSIHVDRPAHLARLALQGG